MWHGNKRADTESPAAVRLRRDAHVDDGRFHLIDIFLRGACARFSVLYDDDPNAGRNRANMQN